ncbi:hypothetical protein PV350_19555 [Streptomyces sp. PA03-6a]|nr:hypothetical protein [Streptomyces sp. PA03-6a]
MVIVAAAADFRTVSGRVAPETAMRDQLAMYLAESQGAGRESWLKALDTIEQLDPTSVVSGYKRDGDPDSPEDIARTRRYIMDFSAARKEAKDVNALYEAMVSRYPDRVNRGVLCNSAKAAMA